MGNKLPKLINYKSEVCCISLLCGKIISKSFSFLLCVVAELPTNKLARVTHSRNASHVRRETFHFCDELHINSQKVVNVFLVHLWHHRDATLVQSRISGSVTKCDRGTGLSQIGLENSNTCRVNSVTCFHCFCPYPGYLIGEDGKCLRQEISSTQLIHSICTTKFAKMQKM